MPFIELVPPAIDTDPPHILNYAKLRISMFHIEVQDMGAWIERNHNGQTIREMIPRVRCLADARPSYWFDLARWEFSDDVNVDFVGVYFLLRGVPMALPPPGRDGERRAHAVNAIEAPADERAHWLRSVRRPS